MFPRNYYWQCIRLFRYQFSSAALGNDGWVDAQVIAYNEKRSVSAIHRRMENLMQWGRVECRDVSPNNNNYWHWYEYRLTDYWYNVYSTPF